MNKLDKIKEVQQFIEQNKDKDLTWCADNNGIVSRRTFFNWRKEGLLSASASASSDASASASASSDASAGASADASSDASASASASASADASASASSDELIQNLLDEHEKNEVRKSKNRQYNYNTRSRKALVEELQKENEELKSKYEELKSKYDQLQTDFIFERQLKDKYANQIHDFPFKQSEFDELKKKYDNLQIEYIALKTGDKPQNKPDKPDKSNKPETKNQTQWWEEI